MCNDLYVRSCDVGVGLNEMGSEDARKSLWRGNGVLFGLDVYRILHRICGNDDAIVGLRVPGIIRCWLLDSEM